MSDAADETPKTETFEDRTACMYVIKTNENGDDLGYDEKAVIKSKMIRVVALVFAAFALMFTAIAASTGDLDFDTIENVNMGNYEAPGRPDGQGFNLYFGFYRLGVKIDSAPDSFDLRIESSLKYDNCEDINRIFSDTRTEGVNPLENIESICGDCKDAFDTAEAFYVITILFHLLGFPLSIMKMSESMNSDGLTIFNSCIFAIGMISSFCVAGIFSDSCYDELPGDSGDEKKFGPAFGLFITVGVLDILIIILSAVAQRSPHVERCAAVPVTPQFYKNLCFEPEEDAGAKTTST
jgi:hypothetical protein